MALNTIADLSTTAGSNVDILGQNATGGGLANTIDTLLQNLMALMARAYGDQGGLGTVGGSANAITLTSLSTYQALASGLTLAFKAASANTGATTLNLDGLGARAVRRQGDSALSANDIVANGRYLVQYDAAYNGAAGAWVLLNPAAYVSGGTDVALADGGTGASLTDPNADRLLFWDDSAGAMTWLSVSGGLDLSGTVLSGGLTLGTAQSPSAVSSVDFTSIPATAKQITISLAGLSTSSANNTNIQIGDSGGVETTGYSYSVIQISGSAGGFASTAASAWITGVTPAAATSTGVAVLTLVDASTNTWSIFYSGGALANADASNAVVAGSGFKSLSGTLDRIRVSCSSTFDAGKINIAYQ